MVEIDHSTEPKEIAFILQELQAALIAQNGQIFGESGAVNQINFDFDLTSGTITATADGKTGEPLEITFMQPVSALVNDVETMQVEP